jgi:hypothetical protein
MGDGAARGDGVVGSRTSQQGMRDIEGSPDLLAVGEPRMRRAAPKRKDVVDDRNKSRLGHSLGLNHQKNSWPKGGRPRLADEWLRHCTVEGLATLGLSDIV